jgi:hypothetical protein
VLKSAHRGVGLRAESAVDLYAFGGVAGFIAELELLLHAAYRVAACAFLDLHDERLPGGGVDGSVGGETFAGLERLHGGVGLRAEYAIERDRMTGRALPPRTHSAI